MLKRATRLTFILIALSACNASAVTPSVTSNITPVKWDVYDPDPQHLWNRLFRAFYGRATKDGVEYGRDTLDPLLWEVIRPTFVKGPAYDQTLQVLDEFLATRGENLIVDPLKRAMLQRDLWAVFDWLVVEAYNSPNQHQALELRLAQAIQRLALTKQQIEILPDNYQAAISSHAFPTTYPVAKSSTPFLPDTLLTPDGEWVSFGREGSPVAITHVQSLPFVGRSVFLLLLHVPSGRQVTLNFFRALQDGAPNLDLTDGTEVALVRRMLLIDAQGNLVASPIVESVQLRYFYSNGEQSFYEFKLSRNRLFRGETGGLEPAKPEEKDFTLFGFHGIDFSDLNSRQAENSKAVTLMTCQACHISDYDRIVGIQSILSFSRRRFPLPDQQKLILTETTLLAETQATIQWKLQHRTWQTLQALWQR